MPYDRENRHSEVTDVKNAKRWLGYVLVALIVIVAAAQWIRNSGPAPGAQNEQTQQETVTPDNETDPAQNKDPADPVQSEDEPAGTLPESGHYTSRDDVALYLHLYGHLPSNFITKKEAEKLGWSGGSLESYAPGCCIGGDRFGNYEGSLPAEEGRIYKECDIDTQGARSRGAKRIVFSNDGLIYYTEDHYKTFTLLYGEEGN